MGSIRTNAEELLGHKGQSIAIREFGNSSFFSAFVLFNIKLNSSVKQTFRISKYNSFSQPTCAQAQLQLEGSSIILFAKNSLIHSEQKVCPLSQSI